MNNYNPTNPHQKVNTRVIQLMLAGLVDPPNQDDSHCTTSHCSCISPRVLKVVEIGDFWAKRTVPSIRLQGKWMIQAGVIPNRHVRITNPNPGVLMIQLVEETHQPIEAGLQLPDLNPHKEQPNKELI
jgi:hypothetical protein